MKTLAVLVAVLAVGCGVGADTMPLEEFCESYADAWCHAETICSGEPQRVCYVTAHVNQCLADRACLDVVPMASECLDAIYSWDCRAWPEACAIDLCG